MRFSFLITALIIFISGCGNENETTIEGRYMFTTDLDGMFQLFVEDNYTGSSYRYLEDLYHVLPENYEAESYIIQVNEETSFIDAETGNSTPLSEINFPFHWPNQKLEVLINEEVPQFTREMDEPVTSDARLLPVYTAQEIKTYPYGYNELIEVHTPVEQNHYMLFIFDEDFNREYLYLLQAFSEEMGDTQETYVDFHYHHPGNFEELMEIESRPAYLLLAAEGEVFRTSDWSAVENFFAAEELHLPREDDPFWYELLIGH